MPLVSISTAIPSRELSGAVARSTDDVNEPSCVAGDPPHPSAAGANASRSSGCPATVPTPCTASSARSLRTRSVPRPGFTVTTQAPACSNPMSRPTCGRAVAQQHRHPLARLDAPPIAVADSGQVAPGVPAALEFQRRRRRDPAPGSRWIRSAQRRMTSRPPSPQPRLGTVRPAFGDLCLADRVAEPGVDQTLLHGGPIRPVERLPDRPDGALRRRRRLARDAGRDLVRPIPERLARARPR